MIEPKALSPDVSVATQIDPGDLQPLSEAGFRSIISNRPDGEDPHQPSWAEIETAARSAGMAARHIPVVPGAIGSEDVAGFAAALEQLPGPVLAFCRTGGRAATLWALSRKGKLPADQIIQTAAQAGYDLSQLRDRLDT